VALSCLCRLHVHPGSDECGSGEIVQPEAR
jgi:hypothetical protein